MVEEHIAYEEYQTGIIIYLYNLHLKKASIIDYIKCITVGRDLG